MKSQSVPVPEAPETCCVPFLPPQVKLGWDHPRVDTSSSIACRAMTALDLPDLLLGVSAWGSRGLPTRDGTALFWVPLVVAVLCWSPHTAAGSSTRGKKRGDFYGDTKGGKMLRGFRNDTRCYFRFLFSFQQKREYPVHAWEG